MLIDAELRNHGSRIFYYSPKHIRSMNDKIPGYLIEKNEFVRAESFAPRVNGNWTYSTRRLIDQGMGYRDFVEWSEANRIGIYVPLAFSELVVNKYDAFRVVRGYRHDIHPDTAPYHQSLEQLQLFMERSNIVFLKPRAGNKGDGILTVKREAEQYVVTYYKSGRRKKKTVASLPRAYRLITAVTGGTKRYLIQEGIETTTYQGSVFDLRVIMLHDGTEWSWLHEARISPRGSELSNVSQGGISLKTEDLLGEVFGKEEVSGRLEVLRSEAFGLAAFLERLHPGELMEFAFDFVLDRDGTPKLVEINSKPGLIGIGFLKSFLDMTPEDRPQFESSTYPHTRSLANFLQSKVVAL